MRCASQLPFEDQIQLIANSLGKNQGSWKKIIPYLAKLSPLEAVALFNTRLPGVLLFEGDTLKQAINNQSSFHPSMTAFLKGIESEVDRCWMISQLFGANDKFLSTMIFEKDSFELLNLFPYETIFSMMVYAISNKLITSEGCAKCIEFSPNLKKGKKVKELKMKLRMERDTQKKSIIESNLQQEREQDQTSIRNAASALHDILLTNIPGLPIKKLFQ